MYVPAHFAMSDAEIRAALVQIQAADLITPGAAGLVATFLPLLYEPATHALLGHVARNNEHWQVAGGAAESLVIARGPDAYISPAWYAAKREHGRVVPTWNYTTLHVHGRLVAHDDPDWLRRLVTRLTERHEAGRPEPWRITDAPQRYIDGQLRAIVGVELQITRIEAKAKLNQNRSAQDRAGVIAGLDDESDASSQALAGLMRQLPDG